MYIYCILATSLRDKEEKKVKDKEKAAEKERERKDERRKKSRMYREFISLLP
jgi:hypothetical protein